MNDNEDGLEFGRGLMYSLRLTFKSAFIALVLIMLVIGVRNSRDCQASNTIKIADSILLAGCQ